MLCIYKTKADFAHQWWNHSSEQSSVYISYPGRCRSTKTLFWCKFFTEFPQFFFIWFGFWMKNVLDCWSSSTDFFFSCSASQSWNVNQCLSLLNSPLPVSVLLIKLFFMFSIKINLGCCSSFTVPSTLYGMRLKFHKVLIWTALPRLTFFNYVAARIVKSHASTADGKRWTPSTNVNYSNPQTMKRASISVLYIFEAAKTLFS